MQTIKSLIVLFITALTVHAEAATFEELIASARANISDKFAADLEADLKALSKISGKQVSKLNYEVFKSSESLNGEDYLKYFLERVDHIRLSPDQSSDAVASYNDQTMTMYIGKNYLKAPAVARMTTLIHEAAHWGDMRGHAYCPTPFLDENGKDRVSEFSGVKLEGKPACAERFADAYVTEFIFLKNVYMYCLNCTDKMKSQAKFYADKVLIRVVDLKIQEVLAKDQ